VAGLRCLGQATVADAAAFAGHHPAGVEPAVNQLRYAAHEGALKGECRSELVSCVGIRGVDRTHYVQHGGQDLECGLAV
jgi:hypothetical protein